MTQRFLAFLLFGMLGLVAWDGFATRAEQREGTAPSATSGDQSQAQVMDGGNPYPLPKKGF
jgi:hypothetical protein